MLTSGIQLAQFLILIVAQALSLYLDAQTSAYQLIFSHDISPDGGHLHNGHPG